MFDNDKRIVMTLDAGGTNLVFTAMQGNRSIVDEIRMDTNSDDLDKCLGNIVKGFELVKEKLSEAPVAISFAFPGPADYPNGIIGDLPNLPAFRGGIALGPMLEEKFGIPVFINNDGDLYAYGEAIAGFLPKINKQFEENGSPRRYKNILGLTLGTGFGAGIVRDNELFLGDNSCAGEIWLLGNKVSPNDNIEENASIRAVRREYAKLTDLDFENSPTPKEIYEIAKGTREGDKQAALQSYEILGEAVGDAISNAITLVDGVVVIGGGLSGAAEFFMPKLLKEMNGNYNKTDGSKLKRLVADVYNLDDENELSKFVKGDVKEITIPYTNKKIKYDSSPRIGIGISSIGTSKAISIGAYAYALHKLDK